jgi:protocatechuate 3,4-dioxygenase beta subunit
VQEAAPDDSEARAAKTGTIELYVVDGGSGVAVEGAPVDLWEPRGDPETANSWTITGTDPDALTDAAGAARVEVPAGVRQRLRVKRPDGTGADVDLNVPKLFAGESRHVKIELPAIVNTAFHGLVVREGDSTPVAGAKVSLTRERYSSTGDGPLTLPPPFASTMTDGDGRFTISAPSWEKSFGRIDATGQSSILFRVSPGHASRDRACELAIPAGARLRVKVVEGGAAASGVTVRATVKSYRISRPKHQDVYLVVDPEWTTVTDASGTGVVEGLAPGVDVTVEILRDAKVERRVPVPFVLEANETREITVRLGGGVKIRGKAVDQDDKPISGATVWLVNPTRELSLPVDMPYYFRSHEEHRAIGETLTSTEGEFTFEDVAAGTWLIGIAPDSDRRMPATEQRVSSNASRVTVLEGAGDVKVFLRATRGLYIRGRVVKPDGSPAANIQVHARGPRGGSIDGRSDDKGEFALGPMIEGQYQVRASGLLKYADSDRVAADAGARDVELRLKASGSIRGRVVNDAGEPCRAEIKWSPASDRSDLTGMGLISMMSTEATGEIDLRGIEPGTYTLVAFAADQRIGVLKNIRVSGESETSSVVVTLRPSGILVVKGREGGASIKYRVAWDGVMIDFGVAPASGKAVRAPVPPGKGTLTYWLENGAAKTRDFEVAAGKELEIVLDGKD